MHEAKYTAVQRQPSRYRGTPAIIALPTDWLQADVLIFIGTHVHVGTTIKEIGFVRYFHS